jgi:hypothetical protein
MPPQQDNPENENPNFTPVLTPNVSFGPLPTPAYPPNSSQETNNLVGPEQPD